MPKFIIEYGLVGQPLKKSIEQFPLLSDAYDRAQMMALELLEKTEEGFKLKEKIYKKYKYDPFLAYTYYITEALPLIYFSVKEMTNIKVKKDTKTILSEVYDIETLSNLFTYTGYCRQTKEYYQFVIHESRNDYERLMEHLFRSRLIMIGYNNDNFDYPILHHLINHYEEYRYLSGQDLAQKIYAKTQEIINSEFNTVASWNKHILQIDLYKIFHFDNAAKRTSLKALEISMRLPLIEDMPYSSDHWITSNEEIEEVLSYNKNDVYATNEFLNIALGNTDHPFYKGKNKIELRQTIQRKYGLECLNFNDIKLGTELILKLYCEEFNKYPSYIRKLRTPRSIINLTECLPKWMDFKTKKFDSLIDKFKKTSIVNGVLKGVLKHSVIYNGIKIDYGTGGAHACIKPGVYSEDEEYGIYDVDIDSLYPTLAISQELYPEHLGPGFLEIYDRKIVAVRVAEKKKPKANRDFVIVEGFKLAANGTYGKTGEEQSWLYDPLYTVKTTVSGQIFISMWAEYICENIPNTTILQINTDGITFRLPKKYKDRLLKLSDEITKKCSLTYEINEYSKMVISDVNNYLSVYKDGNVKYKGCFEIDKELHKDPSIRIIPIALSEYFIKGIPIQETISKHKDIYDFCLRLRVDDRFHAKIEYLTKLKDPDKASDKEKENFLKLYGWEKHKEMYYKDKISKELKEAYEILYNSNLALTVHENLSKTTRYYISNSGGSLYKLRKSDNYKIGVNVGFSVTKFNVFVDKEMKDYNINYNFYIRECNKIINFIEDKHLSLF